MGFVRIVVYGLTVVFVSGAPVSSASAEVICETEISYKWKPAGAEVAQNVSVSRVVRRGADEAAAKLELGNAVLRESHSVRAQCRRAHENMASCLSSKYSAAQRSLDTTSFSARKAIEEAIAADCASQQGACAEVVNSEPKCVEKLEPTPTPAESGKEDKKKKKS